MKEEKKKSVFSYLLNLPSSFACAIDRAQQDVLVLVDATARVCRLQPREIPALRENIFKGEMPRLRGQEGGAKQGSKQRMKRMRKPHAVVVRLGTVLGGETNFISDD